jgi:hypothetical protein
VIVEGKTFGGLPLGLTAAQVERRWGRVHGVCDNCTTTTWYYTFSAFVPRGVGVEFRGGHVDAYFTLGAPPWRTAKGLHVNDPAETITTLYGPAPHIQCTGYELVQVVRRGALLLAYLNGNQVYGLGLAARSVNPCG